MVTAVRFLNGQEVLSLSTAAQNIHVFRRKSPLHKKHFFEWLKTANFSTACGTSTLKSPPSRAFAAPHVHPRPRKRLARCTLDCGFKTPESPELRGFVAGPWALATPALYPAFFFVLEKAVKSAGNAVIPTFPAHCPHGLQHLRHKRPTLAFSGENGYTLGPAQRIAHKGTHGETGGVLGGGWYHYPRSVPHVSETLRGRVSERRTLPLLGLGHGCSQRTQRAFGTAMRLCASLSRGVAAPLGCVILFLLSKLWLVCHALRVFPRVRDMGGITTLGARCVLPKFSAPACQSGLFAVF